MVSRGLRHSFFCCEACDAKSRKGDPDRYHLALEDIETAMTVVRVEDVIAADVTWSCGAERRIIGDGCAQPMTFKDPPRRWPGSYGA